MTLALALNDRTPVAPGAAIHSQNHPYANRTLPHHQSGGEHAVHSRSNIARNDRRDTGRNVRAYTITQGDWIKESQGAFRSHVGHGPGGAKKLANDIECSEKTAQNWLDGKTAPSGILDLRAMHAIPAYAALKREIAAMEMDLDPRVQAKLIELHNMIAALANDPRAAAAVKREQSR